jgi:hypothetical protein
LTTLNFPGAVETFPSGINERGDIVGIYFVDGDPGFERRGYGFVAFRDVPEPTTLLLFGTLLAAAYRCRRSPLGQTIPTTVTIA